MEKKPRIVIYLDDDEYEAVKNAAKRERRKIRNYATIALMERVVEKDQNETD